MLFCLPAGAREALGSVWARLVGGVGMVALVDVVDRAAHGDSKVGFLDEGEEWRGWIKEDRDKMDRSF